MKLLHVVGARPNFPKLAPVYRAAIHARLPQAIVHTGQHYDDVMSDSFFRTLGIPAPDVNLQVGSGSHAVQTARIMERLEPVFLEHRPDWIVVYGDVNSTMAATIVAAKLGLRTAHVEAGLRSDDRSMPEEVNRLVTDRLADLLLTPSRDANERLRVEGESEEKIVFVGNVMIDSLYYTMEKIGLLPNPDGKWQSDGSILVTLHRPSNVDDNSRLAAIIRSLKEISINQQVIFPVHPRTRTRLTDLRISTGAINLIDPVSYEEMVRLTTKSAAVITDSGGLQEETTALGIPCLTIRPNTERPITVTEGTNRLVPDPERIIDELTRINRETINRRPDGWDGAAGERVVTALLAQRK